MTIDVNKRERMQIYTKREALAVIKEAFDLLGPISDDNWQINSYTNPPHKRCCVLGHWTRLHSDNPNDYSTANCAEPLGEACDLRAAIEVMGYDIVAINDGDALQISAYATEETAFCPFNQETPKARVMACLKKIMEDNSNGEKETTK